MRAGPTSHHRFLTCLPGAGSNDRAGPGRRSITPTLEVHVPLIVRHTHVPSAFLSLSPLLASSFGCHVNGEIRGDSSLSTKVGPMIISNVYFRYTLPWYYYMQKKARYGLISSCWIMPLRKQTKQKQFAAGRYEKCFMRIVRHCPQFHPVQKHLLFHPCGMLTAISIPAPYPLATAIPDP